MSSKEVKMEEDFSPVVDVKIPENRKLAVEQGQLARAVENLLALEKQTRQAADAVSTARVLECIVELCFELKDFKALRENIVLLPKRRGQLKQATKRMVKKVMSFLDQMDYDNKMETLQTLLSVTEGKIFLEKQGGRLTLQLAKIRESEGKVAEAATILQEVQVETFGSMKKKEKTNYILEQMRLCLRKKDYIRAQIMSRKINPKVLEDKDFQEERIKYHNLMIDYWLNENKNYLQVYRSFYAIFTTPSVQAAPAQWQEALKNCVIFIALAPYGNEQNDLINRLSTAEEKKLQQIPMFKELIKRFLTMEILHWNDVEARFLPELRSLNLFQGPLVDTLIKDLHAAVTEHNLRTIAKYYSKISLSRLAQMLSLPEAEAEKQLCDLVIKKSIFARIDRVAGLVNFIKRQDAAEVLNDWSGDLSQLLNVMERACHLIHRENMIHGIETN